MPLTAAKKQVRAFEIDDRSLFLSFTAADATSERIDCPEGVVRFAHATLYVTLY